MERDHLSWTVMRNVGHLMERVRDHELAEYGINARQAGMLRHIKVLGDEATPAQIARTMFREPTSVSALIIRMEKQGLVKRLKDRKEKNQVRVCLTEKGEKAYRDAAKRDSIDHIMSRLSETNRQNLLEALLELRRSTLEEFLKCKKISYPDELITNLKKTSAPL